MVNLSEEVVGARPIEGRVVLNIVWQFFVFWWSFMSTSTQTSCYVMVILGWGWVGWGGAIMFMSTCTHTSCYVMVIFSCTCTHTSCYVMVIFSCTCTHTSCYAMVIFSCTCRWKPCLGVTCQKFEELLRRRKKKCSIPKKHELMSKNEVVLEIFKTLFFTSTW